ncbi:MAG: GH92 family glycosyl hydrolase [Candidatus Thermochlorobacter sp.]
MLGRYAVLYLALMMQGQPLWSQPLTHYVNPMIGTGGHGHTFPGAASPFGMIQLSPDQFNAGWDWCSGYHYSDSLIIGFSHLHLSGTGIGELGDILLMPTVGALKLTPATRQTWQQGYGSYFSHHDEHASPGYYRVYLHTYEVDAELTATTHAGMHRYTFPKTDSAHIILNLHHGIGWDECTDAQLAFRSDTLLTGYRRSSGWAADQLVYFAMAISKQPESIGVATDSSLFPNQRTLRSPKARAWLSFKTEHSEKILVKVALSFVSEEGALENLRQEIQHWEFERIRRATEQVWEEQLRRIVITDASEEEKTVFYTALYHTMLSPMHYQDLDGRYRGSEPKDKRIHSATGFTNYTVFSLWDTFRAWHTLATLVFPERVRDFLYSFLAQYKEFGELPVWSLVSNETYTMIGYHAVVVIAEAIAKGFLSKKEVAVFFEAMKSSAMKDARGLEPYRTYGYIPFELEPESVSKTLEYAYDDWCLAQVANVLGRKGDEAQFLRRATFYQNLFDRSTNFMRPKDAKGEWKQPFNPRNVEHRKDDFTEGNSWQYTWFVPHDIAGLIRQVGGKKPFIEKLDSLFEEPAELGAAAPPDVSGLIGQYAHGNEPSQHIAYLYAYAGAPEKTAERVRQVLTELYNSTSEGLCGNDDCGQLSAWYVLSALGFYPVNPAEAIYVFGSPLFPKATLKLGKGKTLSIEAKNVSKQNRYIQSITFNGKPIETVWIRHQDIVQGGKLVFEMGATPHPTWGKSPQAAPPSMSQNNLDR